jgi:hypothetical protein
MKKLLNQSAVFVLLILVSGIAGAQTVSQKCFYSIDKLERHNLWLSSDNAAGIVFNQNMNFSVINSYFSNEKGNYQNYNDPGIYNVMGIETKSYVKSKNVYYYGELGYDYGIRQQQAWLGTIHPNSNFNTINDSIPGKVLNETYTLGTKIGYKLNKTIAIGAGFNYITSTSAKRVDGRNQNTLSYLKFNPSILFDFKYLTFGVGGIYQKSSEKVNFSFIGDKTGKYMFYFDGGLFMNTTAGLTNTTILDRMYQKDVYGGSAQIQVKWGKFSFLNTLSLTSSDEDDFEDDNLTKRFATVEGLKYDYTGIMALRSKKMHQYLNIKYVNDENLSYNVINNYEAVPGETNSWAYYEYGKVLRYSQIVKQFGIEYQNYIRRADHDYSWIITAGYKTYSIDKEYKVYPAAYNQDYSKTEIYGGLTKSFATSERSRFELSVLAGKVNADGTLINEVNPLTTGLLKQNTALLKTDYAFNVSDLMKWNFGAKFQQAFGKMGRSAFAQVKYTTLKVVSAPDLGADYADFKDKTRNYFEFSLGYNF